MNTAYLALAYMRNPWHKHAEVPIVATAHCTVFVDLCLGSSFQADKATHCIYLFFCFFCLLVVRFQSLSDEDATLQDTLHRRLGNTLNVYGSILLNEVARSVQVSPPIYDDQTMEKWCHHACSLLLQGIESFKQVDDVVNQVLVKCNFAKLMRVNCTRVAATNKPQNAPVSTSELNYHARAVEAYKEALLLLKKRGRHPDVWDSVQQQLAGAYLGFATLLQDYHTGSGSFEEEVYTMLRDAIALLQGQLEYFEDDPTCESAIYLRDRLIDSHWRLGRAHTVAFQPYQQTTSFILAARHCLSQALKFLGEQPPTNDRKMAVATLWFQLLQISLNNQTLAFSKAVQTIAMTIKQFPASIIEASSDESIALYQQVFSALKGTLMRGLRQNQGEVLKEQFRSLLISLPNGVQTADDISALVKHVNQVEKLQ
eukprot:m.31913 g.31913  ORF g.31913 m.31913 type:complete len:427 (+) comp9478_c0_seq1:12-1292(+)